MDASVTLQPVHGFADIGNGVQYDTVLVRQVRAVWLIPLVDGKEREVVHEPLEQVANIVSSVFFLYMRYIFRGDTGFKEQIANLVTSCHVREADGEIGLAVVGEVQFPALVSGDCRIYSPFLQVPQQGRVCKLPYLQPLKARCGWQLSGRV